MNNHRLCLAGLFWALFALIAPVRGEDFTLQLERSHNLRDWETVPITPEMLDATGRIVTAAPVEASFFGLRIEGSTIPKGFSPIPAGTFTMGSPDDEPGRVSRDGPQHEVTLTRSFYLQQTPVTWRQWNDVRDWAVENGYTDLVRGQKGSHGDGRNTDDDPVTMVNWYDVVKWLNARSEKEELVPAYHLGGEVYRIGQAHVVDVVTCDFDASGYRLPTEAEWEYAARAGTTTAFYSGPITQTGISPIDPNLDPIGWYGGNSGLQTHPVGQKEPNAWGLHDMSGHVFEWCGDGAFRTYTTSAVTDPTGPSSEPRRVARGGSWLGHAWSSRSAHRDHSSPDSSDNYLGFRMARSETERLPPLMINTAPVWNEEFELRLEHSRNLKDWEMVPITPGMLNTAGRMVTKAPGDADFFRLLMERAASGGFSRIYAGTFIMGSPDDELGRLSTEGPQHEVTLTRSFHLQQKPVTWAQWNDVRNWALGSGLPYAMAVGQKGSHGDSRNTDDDPVTMVNWYDVVKWLNARSEKEGLAPAYRLAGLVYRNGEHSNVSCDFDASGYRLPTEADWEHAARAGTTTAFYSGPIMHTGSSPVDPSLDLIGWYSGNSNKTHPVGQKQPNAWGLYDMSGNVWEWCWDGGYRIYTTSAVTDPAGPTGLHAGTYRVIRGGGWAGDANLCRSADRRAVTPGNRIDFLGFRPARGERREPPPVPEGFVLVEGGTLPAVSAVGELHVETFFMGRHELTWGEWQEVRAWAAANGYDIGNVGEGCADEHPVRAVNWYDALKWCNAKSEMEGLTPVYTVSGLVYRTGQTVPVQNLSADGYRLPLEMEWEYAARGGNRSAGFTYSGGNNLDAVGWYSGNNSGAACPVWGGRGTWPVGQKAGNELGLHDMSGNLWEWCWDAAGTARRVRGGSVTTATASGCSVTSRGYNNPADRTGSDGLRLARTPAP